jgi:hypothetical protein
MRSSTRSVDRAAAAAQDAYVSPSGEVADDLPAEDAGSAGHENLCHAPHDGAGAANVTSRGARRTCRVR